MSNIYLRFIQVIGSPAINFRSLFYFTIMCIVKNALNIFNGNSVNKKSAFEVFTRNVQYLRNGHFKIMD